SCCSLERSCFLQQNFLNSFAPGATHSNSKPRNLEFCAGGRQITQPGKNKSADRVYPFRVDAETKMFAYIVETRVAAHEKSTMTERLDIKSDIVPRHRIAKDLFDDVLHGDNPFDPAKLVNHHCHTLGVSYKKLEQFERMHRLGNKRGSDEFFGVMFRCIKQEQFHIDDP